MVSQEIKELLIKQAIEEYGDIITCESCIDNPDKSFHKLKNITIYWFDTPDRSTHLVGVDNVTLKPVKVYNKSCI